VNNVSGAGKPAVSQMLEGLLNTSLNRLTADLMAWKAELDDEIQRTEQHLQEIRHKAKLLEMMMSLLDVVIVKPKSVEKK
jgi:hypothetical protein